jgi:hypothetical protein
MRSLPADGGTSSQQSPLRETKMGPKTHSSADTMNEIRGRSQHNHLNEIEFLNTTAFWKVDVTLARVLALSERHTVELRIEAFNALNNFNWGDPAVNLDVSTFGKINTQNGNSRIMQFAIKYGF